MHVLDEEEEWAGDEEEEWAGDEEEEWAFDEEEEWAGDEEEEWAGDEEEEWAFDEEEEWAGDEEEEEWAGSGHASCMYGHQGIKPRYIHLGVTTPLSLTVSTAQGVQVQEAEVSPCTLSQPSADLLI